MKTAFSSFCLVLRLFPFIYYHLLFLPSKHGRILTGNCILVSNGTAYAFGIYCLSQIITKQEALLMALCAFLRLCPDNFSMAINRCPKSQRIIICSQNTEKFQRGISNVWYNIQVLGQQKQIPILKEPNPDASPDY